MATKKTTKAAAQRVDIFESAFKTNSGEPKPATLHGIDFNVRRNFTGAEVAAYIGYMNTHTWDPENIPSPEDQISYQLGLLTDLEGENLQKILDWMLESDVMIAGRILVELGKVAGLRSEDGNFLAGRKH